MYGGDQYWTFCYVTDAARMMINLMNDPTANGLVVNVGNDSDFLRISSVAKRVSTIIGMKPKMVEKGDPKDSVQIQKLDLRTIKRLGDFVYEVPFDEGLRRTVHWYSSRHYHLSD